MQYSHLTAKHILNNKALYKSTFYLLTYLLTTEVASVKRDD